MLKTAVSHGSSSVKTANVLMQDENVTDILIVGTALTSSSVVCINYVLTFNLYQSVNQSISLLRTRQYNKILQT